jgi:Flp pilus assembly protein TadG
VLRQGLRRRVRDRGTATVEFALVVPILLMLVFGIVDFGRMASMRTQLTAAARAGAQAYALGANPTSAAQAIVPGATASAVGSSCGAHPSPSQTATVEVVVDFTFVTPLAVFIGGGPNEMHAIGVVPCRA